MIATLHNSERGYFMKEDSEKRNSEDNVVEKSTTSKNSGSKVVEKSTTSKNSGSKVVEKSTTSKNSGSKVVEKSTTSKSMKNFLKKLDFTPQGNESEKKEEETKDPKDHAPEHDPHALPIIGDILSSDKWDDLKSGKNNLLVGIGIFVGAFLIGLGFFLMIGSPERVADNVQFGDMASFSVFLILAGVLVIAGVFASKFLNKSFFKGMNKKVESHNETSSNSTKEEYKKG